MSLTVTQALIPPLHQLIDVIPEFFAHHMINERIDHAVGLASIAWLQVGDNMGATCYRILAVWSHTVIQVWAGVCADSIILLVLTGVI